MSHVVVVGGGHNGLVAANYLARAGRSVTVLEARQGLGGPVGRVEYLPGYSASVTNSPGSLEGRIIEELELERHGLRFIKPPVTLLQPFASGLFIGWRDRERVAAQMDEFAPGEADRHSALIAQLDRLGSASGLSLWEPPTAIDAVLANMPEAVRAEFQDVILDGSLMELLDSSLKSDEAKSMMMMLALNGQLIDPTAPGSAMGLLLRPISRASSTVDTLGIRDAPLRGSVGLIAGSMSSIVEALTRSALEHGVTIRTSAKVTEMTLNDESQIDAVVLESGEEIRNIDHVVATLEPSRLAELLPTSAFSSERLPEPPQGSAFKIALGLDELPAVADAPDGVDPVALLSAQFRIGPSSAYIARAVMDGLHGRPSSGPIMWGLVPSLTSPGLAPPGKHLMSINVWHAPHCLGHEYWTAQGEAFMNTCIEHLDEVFPGLKQRINGATWFGPHDLEREFGLTGSNITHGDMLASQLLDGRPGASFAATLRRMNIELGGAGSWPGGYVTGAPGRNAAAAILTTHTKGIR